MPRGAKVRLLLAQLGRFDMSAYDAIRAWLARIADQPRHVHHRLSRRHAEDLRKRRTA
jgi:hypothetical protein